MDSFISDLYSSFYKSFMGYKLRIHNVTWNTNRKPPPDDLDKLFIYKADIYAIGLQELGNQNWMQALDNALSDEPVIRIKTRRLQGILLVVYIQRYLLNYVSHIESESTKTGLAGMWGNKGGVSIRFDILGVNVIIVNCHLAAHDNQVMQRVQDINEIIETQKFRDEHVHNILDHDYVFWMGDLNFRVNLPYEVTLAYLESGNIKPLLKNDQMITLMKEGLIFPEFKEAPITFKPSYKYDEGTNIFDTSAKKRVPSYCDRVICMYHNTTYGRRDNLKIKTCDYRAHFSYLISDHKPVSGTLDFLGLSKPIVNPVTFRISATLSRNSPMDVFYVSRGMELTTNDWVGIYNENFLDLMTAITFQYVQIGSDLFNGMVQFPTSAFNSLPRKSSFLLLYFSKKYSFSGISRLITLQD